MSIRAGVFKLSKRGAAATGRARFGSRRAALPAFHLVMVVTLVWVVTAAVRGIGSVSPSPRAWEVMPLALLPLALACHITMLIAAWGLLLRAVRPEQPPPPALVVRSFMLGWLVRYMPGPPVGAAGRYLVCREGGYPRAHVAAVLVYEMVLQTGTGVLLPVLTLGFFLGRGALWLVPLGVAASVGLTALATAPPVMRRLVRWAGTDGAALPCLASPRALAAPALCSALATLCAALSFHLIALAVTPLGSHDLGRVVFAYTLASVIGFVVPLVPSGAGIREAVLVATLGARLGTAEALQLAVLARAALVLFDAVLAVALLADYGRGRLSSPRAARTPAKKRA